MLENGIEKKNLPWCVFSIEIGGRNSGNFFDGYEVTMQIEDGYEVTMQKKVMVSNYIHHLLNYMTL